MNYWTESRDNVYVAAHRGWSSRYPENTMEAFEAAAKLPIDQIETDVRVTKDGELVIMHDETVDRTTNGRGRVNSFTLEELRKLDAGSWKGEAFAGAKVPTLEEFLAFAVSHSELTYDIELKEYPEGGSEAVAYEVCDRVLARVDELGLTERVVINTFSGKLHEYIFRKYGKKFRQHIYYPITHMRKGITIDPCSYAFCVCMFRSWYREDNINMATAEEFRYFAERGVEPWAGTAVKDEASVKMAVDNGAPLITCNNPDEVIALLARLGKHRA